MSTVALAASSGLRSTFSVASGAAAEGCASPEQAAARGLAIAHGMDFARDLGNLPANVCTPSYLAGAAQDLGKEFPDIKVTVLERNEIEELGIEAYNILEGFEGPPGTGKGWQNAGLPTEKG